MPKHPEAELYRCLDCTHAFSLPSSIAATEAYEESYFDGDHRRWFENPNIALFSRILDHIPDGASVLDVGCGKGDFLRFARRSRGDLLLTGIDLYENKPVEGIRFLRADAVTWQTRERFSAIVSLAVIEHVQDILWFAQRLCGLATRDAVVAVMTLNDSSVLYSLARCGRALGVSIAFDRVYSKHHLHHFTPESLRHTLEKGGLNVTSQFTHAAPIEAMDVPASSPILDRAMRVGLLAVWLAGTLTRRGYLQTAICKAS